MNRSRPAPRRRRRAVVACAALALAGVAVPLAVRAQVAGFKDIPKGHWAADSVAHLVAAGILKGAPGAPFAPAQAAPASGAGPKYDGNRPVTRYELAVTLYRFVGYIERANKQPKGKLSVKGEPKSGPQAVQTLVAGGYLARDTPLARNGSQAVTAQQFADALSQVIVKSREDVTPASPDSQPGIERPQGSGAARS